MSAAAYTIDLTPLVTDVIAPLATAVLTPLISWVVWRVVQLLHLKLTAAQAQVVEGAMQNGIAFAMSRAQDLALQHAQVPTKSFIVKTAANYVMPKVPSALAKLGITPEGLEQRIEARLPPVSVPVVPDPTVSEAPH
jgi:hypothetical protein